MDEIEPDPKDKKRNNKVNESDTQWSFVDYLRIVEKDESVIRGWQAALGVPSNAGACLGHGDHENAEMLNPIG